MPIHFKTGNLKELPPGAWMFVCCECCVLSGRGLCDELITRPEESYRLWCVVVYDLETSRMRRPRPTGGCCAERKKNLKEKATYLEGMVGRQCGSLLFRNRN